MCLQILIVIHVLNLVTLDCNNILKLAEFYFKLEVGKFFLCFISLTTLLAGYWKYSEY